MHGAGCTRLFIPNSLLTEPSAPTASPTAGGSLRSPTSPNVYLVPKYSVIRYTRLLGRLEHIGTKYLCIRTLLFKHVKVCFRRLFSTFMQNVFLQSLKVTLEVTLLKVL